MLHDELPSKEIGVLWGQVLEQVHIGMRSDLHVAKVAAMQVPVRPARQPPGCLHAMFLLGIVWSQGGYVTCTLPLRDGPLHAYLTLYPPLCT